MINSYPIFFLLKNMSETTEYPLPPFPNCICENLILTSGEFTNTSKSIFIGKEGCYLIQITQQSGTKYIYWKDELQGFEIWGETSECIETAKTMLQNWISFVILCYKRNLNHDSMEIDNGFQVEASTKIEVSWALSYLKTRHYSVLDLSKENIIQGLNIPPLVRPPVQVLSLVDNQLGKKSYKLHKKCSILYDFNNPNCDIVFIKRQKNSFEIYSSNKDTIPNVKKYILEVIHHIIKNYTPKKKEESLPVRCQQWVTFCEQNLEQHVVLNNNMS